MGFNFAELQQKADRVLWNSDEFIRRWVEFITAPAGTVTLEYYDENGNLVTQSFDNKNKLIQNFIAGANSAMSKTFYVDAENGDDGNDGSQANPFKTIKKAIDSGTTGGSVTIRLTAGQTFNIDSDIFITNKRIYIAGDATNKPTIQNVAYANSNNETETYGFNILNSQLIFNSCNIITPNYASGTSDMKIWEGFIKRYDITFGSLQLTECDITLGDTDLVRLPSGPATLFVDLYGVNISRNGANRNAYIIYNESGIFGFSTFNETLPSGTTWNDFISGIVTDSNGVPRNVISNIIF